MGIAGIDHIGLTVADVDRSARWYEDVLGFTTVGRHQEVGEGGLRKMVFMTCPRPGDRVRLRLTPVQRRRRVRRDGSRTGPPLIPAY